jgi:hypothetical protein
MTGLVAVLAMPVWVASCGDSAPSLPSLPEVPVELDGGIDAASDLGGGTDTDPGVPDVADVGPGTPDVPAADVPDPTGACRTDQCEIDGACFDNGTANPDNPCEVCRVPVAATAWSFDDEALCDDDDACTSDDRCFEGACTGTLAACDDGNPCTAGICDPDTGACSFVPAEGPCDDGDACTVDDMCMEGLCMPGSARSCDDGNVCTVNSCDPSVGCVETFNDGAACDDGEVCTVETTCDRGRCVGGAPRDCDDASVCTIDRCVPGVGCESISIADRCDDGNLCTDDRCDAALGCVYDFNSEPCNDGNACTGMDVCTGGACLGMVLDPDDGNVCTDDFCDPATGFFAVPNDFVCDDGNPCTVGDFCAEGGCQPGVDPLNCDDGNVCTSNFCDPVTGCDFTFNTSACDDNSVCTINDTCAEGGCMGTPISCDDGNACTADSCDAVLGCRSTLIQTATCRPNILIEFPPRGATLVGNAEGQITVRGRVFSGAGPITAFSLNGTTVALGEDGSFAVPFDAAYGNNVLAFEATDSFETTRERIQSFLWADEYFGADQDNAGVVSQGLGIVLGQATLDQIGGLLAGVVGDLDFTALLGADPSQQLYRGQSRVFGSADGLSANRTVSNNFNTNDRLTFLTATRIDVIGNADLVVWLREFALAGSGSTNDPEGYIPTREPIRFGEPTARLDLREGGIDLVLTVPNIVIDLRVYCFGNFAVCSLIGGGFSTNTTVTTDVRVQSLVAVVPVDLTFADGALVTGVRPSRVTLNGVTSSNGTLNAAAGTLVGSLTPSLQEAIDASVAGLLGDALGGLLDALSINLPLELPSLVEGGEPIQVQLESTVSDLDIRPTVRNAQGVATTAGDLALFLDVDSSSSQSGSSFIEDVLGAPGRSGCDFLRTQGLSLLRQEPLEVGLQDDALSRVLYQAWVSGFLEQELPSSLFEGVDLSSFGVTGLELSLAAMLPPALSDCADTDAEPLLQLGDLRIDAIVNLLGLRVPFEIFVHADIRLGIEGGEGGIGIFLRGVEEIQLEVTAVNAEQAFLEPVLKDLIQSQLEDALLGLFGGGDGEEGGPLFSFELPSLDLGGLSEDFAGTSLVLAIDESRRIDGTTLLLGDVALGITEPEAGGGPEPLP